MREYTAKEQRLLLANPYTYKVTRNRLYFTAAFKEEFWAGYQAGVAPRKMLSNLGYDPGMFGQKQVDSMVQSIKRQAASGEVVVPVEGEQSNEEALGRRRSVWDDEDDVDDDW